PCRTRRGARPGEGCRRRGRWPRRGRPEPARDGQPANAAGANVRKECDISTASLGTTGSIGGARRLIRLSQLMVTGRGGRPGNAGGGTPPGKNSNTFAAWCRIVYNSVEWINRRLDNYVTSSIDRRQREVRRKRQGALRYN